ncbi:5-hydroxytryptamine receptor 4-like [Silurus asotus]|uniref:5-hydroxytryptamine receptor 4-like n=1 Tax=Silurus asotus TaxID=30991 RepID=A0AAD5ANP4_SILAS|nr:5-hydroxytryptamine receptor 4-like [Silurus asotus]
MLSISDAEKLVHAIMTSRIDYCNALLACSHSHTRRHKRVDAPRRILDALQTCSKFIIRPLIRASVHQEWAKGEQAGNVQPSEYGKRSVFLLGNDVRKLWSDMMQYPTSPNSGNWKIVRLEPPTFKLHLLSANALPERLTFYLIYTPEQLWEFTMANSSAWMDLSNKSFIGYLECAKARSLSLRVALYSFIMVGIFCTVVGNFLVVLAIAYFKQLRSHTNSFVMSLAVADFLVGLVVMPYSMIRTVEGCWNFGKMFCQLHSSLDVMLCTASIFHLSCIAFDRYYAVCNPLVYSFKMSRSRVSLLIVICWAVPLLISFGPILLGLHELGLDVPLPENVCVLLVNRVYAIIASLVAFYLPMATMLFAYWKIYKAAKRQAMQISALESQMAAGMGKNSSKKLKHRNYLRREKKAAKTLGIIMGVFILFWLPFFTVNIVDPFIEYQTTSVIWDIFLWLGYINSSLNPFLYGFFNRSFRRAFLMIMGCRICLPGSAPSMELSHSKKDTNEHTEK